MQIHRYLDLNEDSRAISCRECGETICDAAETIGKHASMRTGPVTDAGPAFVSPVAKLGDETDLEFLEFFCPECGVLLQTEFARSEDPVLQDIEIDIESL